LRYLLGYQDVANYDGSWTEWGNMVAAPIERGVAVSTQTKVAHAS
jgi:thiosulfate/3-mercaptopyruvate sulfurtransferase